MSQNNLPHQASEYQTQQQSSTHQFGFAGQLAAKFQNNALTPLLAIVALLMGLFAVLVTPREEEPQINVTMANVLIPFPGASSEDVQNKVARPAEQVLGQIAGIEHTYSVSRPGMAVLTVQSKWACRAQMPWCVCTMCSMPIKTGCHVTSAPCRPL